jgi:hypothetical protein
MKKTEKILGLIFLLAILLKVFNIPGNSMLIGISLIFLAIMYYPLGFIIFNRIPIKGIFKRDSYKGLTGWRILGTVFLGMGLSVLIIGILFKLLHYPSAKTNMIAGLIATLIALIIAIIKFIKTKSEFYKELLIRITIIVGFGTLMILTSDLTIEKIQYRNHPTYIKAYENYIKDKDNKVLWYKLEKERYKYIYGEQDYEYLFKTDYPEYLED